MVSESNRAGEERSDERTWMLRIIPVTKSSKERSDELDEATGNIRNILYYSYLMHFNTFEKKFCFKPNIPQHLKGRKCFLTRKKIYYFHENRLFRKKTLLLHVLR